MYARTDPAGRCPALRCYCPPSRNCFPPRLHGLRREERAGQRGAAAGHGDGSPGARRSHLFRFRRANLRTQHGGGTQPRDGLCRPLALPAGRGGGGRPGAVRARSAAVSGRRGAGARQPAAERGRPRFRAQAGFAVAGAGEPGLRGGQPGEGAAGRRASEAAGRGRRRFAAGSRRRRGRVARRRRDREGQPGHRRTDRALHQNPDRFHRGPGRIEPGRAAHRRAESRVRHHSRAHRRPHRRFAGAGGRAGDAHGGATALHHRSARSHVGPLPGDRIGIHRLDQTRAAIAGRATDADPRRRLRVPRQGPRHRHAQPGGPEDRHAGTPGQLPQRPAHPAARPVRPHSRAGGRTQRRHRDPAEGGPADPEYAGRIHGGPGQ